jgi:glucose-1-phosphatase
MPIRAIIFDLGGVIIDVDYRKTIEAFEALGATNSNEIYTQALQKDYVDEFERGVIPKEAFIDRLRADLRGLREDVTNKQIEDAWNAMLTGFQPGRFEFIKNLREQGYKIFLFPNIDAIHYEGVMDWCDRCGVGADFERCFDRRYFSHIFHHNKPSVVSFRALADDIKTNYGIDIGDMFFCDDSKKHIHGSESYPGQGAIAAGMHGLLLTPNLPTTELVRCVTTELQQLNEQRFVMRPL